MASEINLYCTDLQNLKCLSKVFEAQSGQTYIFMQQKKDAIFFISTNLSEFIIQPRAGLVITSSYPPTSPEVTQI